MSWPSTDFECEIQERLDELDALKTRLKKWTDRSAETKKIVLDDLRGIADSWRKAADEPDAFEDAETLKLIVDLLEGF